MRILQCWMSAIGGMLGWYLGGVDGFMYALLTFVVVDYLTGVMVAILEQRISSAVGFKGIFKKVLIFILVGIAHMVDFYLIENGSAIRTAVIFFYIANEGISIIENSAKIGLPVPDKLKAILDQIKKESE